MYTLDHDSQYWPNRAPTSLRLTHVTHRHIDGERGSFPPPFTLTSMDEPTEPLTTSNMTASLSPTLLVVPTASKPNHIRRRTVCAPCKSRQRSGWAKGRKAPCSRSTLARCSSCVEAGWSKEACLSSLDTFKKHWERFEAERLAAISNDAGDRAELGPICTNVRSGPVRARSRPIRTYADYLERPTSAPTASFGDKPPSVATASLLTPTQQDTRVADVGDLGTFDARLDVARSDVYLRRLDDAAATQSGKSDSPSVPPQCHDRGDQPVWSPCTRSTDPYFGQQRAMSLLGEEAQRGLEIALPGDVFIAHPEQREKSLPEISSVEAASRSAEWWQTMLSDDFFDETAASLRD